MGKPKSKSQREQRKRRRRRGNASSASHRKAGVMMGMRSGFKGIADSVTGQETSKKYRRWGQIVTILLVIAAVALLANRFL